MQPVHGPAPLWRELVGEVLRRRRHELGRTLAETADRAGVSPQYLSEMERGAKDPSSEMVAAVAGALGLELIDLAEAVAAGLRARATVLEPSVRTGRGPLLDSPASCWNPVVLAA